MLFTGVFLAQQQILTSTNNSRFMVNVNEIDSIRLILFSIAIDIIILSYYECRMVKINDDG